MALREPNGENTRVEINYSDTNDPRYGCMDYRSSQVRDLRDAVNEWIKFQEDVRELCINPQLDGIVERLIQVESRIEALEKNTPKGGHVLPQISDWVVVDGAWCRVEAASETTEPVDTIAKGYSGIYPEGSK